LLIKLVQKIIVRSLNLNSNSKSIQFIPVIRVILIL